MLVNKSDKEILADQLAFPLALQTPLLVALPKLFLCDETKQG